MCALCSSHLVAAGELVWSTNGSRKYADAVVAIDHTVAGTLAADLSLTVIHNGLRVSAPAESSFRKKTLDSSVRVGFVGVLIPLKGIYEVIEAMRILKDRNVSIKCIVAGENARELSGMRAWALKTLGFSKRSC